jgi:hypothetical protein
MSLALTIALALAPLTAAQAANTRAQDRPRLLSLTPADRQAVQWSLGIATKQLRHAECLKVFEEFRLPGGSTPRQNLDQTGLSAEEFLGTLEWESGAVSGRCEPGALLATTREAKRISVCPGFAKIVASRPAFGATLIIHEQLHALGLGENPPLSTYITARVYHWCR